MSATAQKRSVPPPVPLHGASRRSSTLLPPPNPIGPTDGRVPALSELIEQVDDSSVVEIDSDVAEAPELQDTLVPDSGIVECAARLSAEPPSASGFMTAAARERAELDIQDYSLRLDNPYALSSLVPPKPRNWRRTALLGVTAVAAAALASLVGNSLLPVAPVAPRKSEHPPSAAIAHEAAMSSAPEREASSLQSEGSLPVIAAPVASPPSVTPPQTLSTESTTVSQTHERPPAVRFEKRASKLATPPRPSRARAGRKPSSTSGEAPAAALRVTPTREQVIAGFSQIRDEFVRCAGGKSGVVEIQATILSSGRISTAVIGGAFQGTAEGSCMAQAARLASFGRFSQPTLKVVFPIAL